MFFYIYSDLCSRKNISCKAAAMEMGLSGATAAKWKATGATPNGATLHKVADYFGVPVEYLLGLTPESHLIELEWEFAEVSAKLDSEPDNLELQSRYGALKEQIEDLEVSLGLQGTKKDPFTMSDEEVDNSRVVSALQAFRDVDRGLFEVTADMTPDEVKLLTEFARSLKDANRGN